MMIRATSLVLGTLLCVTTALATERQGNPTGDEFEKRIGEAVSLNDAGQYDAAISIYKELLKSDPKNPRVLYELAYSSMSGGKPKDATEYAEQALRLHSRYDNQCYLVLGSSYDSQGDLAKGEKAFRRGLKAFPQDAPLHFNLGVNLATQKRINEAIEEFQNSLVCNPGSASGWRALGVACQSIGQRTRAFVAYARFLTLEPDSKRSPSAASQLWELLFAGVKVESAGGTSEKMNITLSVPQKKNADPTSAQDLAMSMVAALRYTEEWKDKSDAQFFVHASDTVLAILTEADPKSKSKDPFWSAVATPYFRDVREAGHLEAMAYTIRRSLGDSETLRWINEHTEAVDRFGQWSRDWKMPHE